MDGTFFQLLIFGVLAAAANVLGGLTLFPSSLRSRYQSVLKYLLALGAGFMLAVAIFEIIPKSIAAWHTGSAPIAESLAMPLGLLLAGYMVTQLFEHTVAPHLHLGGEMHCDEHDHELISRRTAYAAIAGLLLHTFFDGVSIAAVSHTDTKGGALVFLAVFLHKVPEGFTIGSMLMAAGRPFREVIYATAVTGAASLVGVFVFYFLGANAESAVAYALPIAAGVTLYVAASDLIPEVNHHAGKHPAVSLAVFAGVALFFGIQMLLHSLLGEH